MFIDELPRETEDMRDATAFPDAEAANQANFHEYLEPGAHSVNVRFSQILSLNSTDSPFLGPLARDGNPNNRALEVPSDEKW